MTAGIPHAHELNRFKKESDAFFVARCSATWRRVRTQKLRMARFIRNHFLPRGEQVEGFSGFLVVARTLLQAVCRFR